ncbi:MAG: hypothetical protein ACOYK6_06575, partial [Chthoniobacterales bacterium]
MITPYSLYCMRLPSFIKTNYFLLLLIFLFLSKNADSSQPKRNQITLADGTTITDIIDSKIGSDFSIVLRSDGIVLGQGKNRFGQLGIGTTFEEFFTPLETSTGFLENVVSISCSDTSTTAIKKDGSIWNSSDEINLLELETSRNERKTSAQHDSEIKLTDFYNNNVAYQNSFMEYHNDVEQILLASGNTKDEAVTLLSLSDASEKQPSPQQPTTISIAATGPYRAPAQIELIASVTRPTNVTISRVEFHCMGKDKDGNDLDQCLGIAEKEPYETAWPNVSIGHYSIEARAYVGKESIVATATTQVEVVPSNRYNRGWGNNPSYLTSIIALDLERGITLDDITDFRTLFSENKYPLYPWFLRLTSSFPELNKQCYHLDIRQNNLTYSPVNSLPKMGDEIVGGQPPFVAFGSQGGGTPLYVNQDYHFGIAAGGKAFYVLNNPDILIEVYDKKDFQRGATKVAPICTKTYSLPSFENEKEWQQFLNKEEVADYHLIDNRYQTPIDFDTQIQYTFLSSESPMDTWGQILAYPLHITHRAANSSYYYKISIMGTSIAPCYKNDGTPIVIFPDLAQKNPGIITNIGNDKTYNLTYTLDFDDPAPWSTTLITLPHFQG